jgi:hypothetical protein
MFPSSNQSRNLVFEHRSYECWSCGMRRTITVKKLDT